MPTTVEAAHLEIEGHQREIKRLLAQVPQDKPSIEWHFGEVQKLSRVIESAKHITAAAPRYEPRPEITAFFERFFPHAQTLFTPGALRATR